MILNILILILTLVGITYGANFLTNGSVAIAQRLKMSPLAIGLTIVAFGTSAPELAVSLASSLSGSPDIALGNVIGSNIANILLIGGLTALVCPLVVQRSTMNYEIPFTILISLVLFLLLQDTFFGAPFAVLGRWDGVVLLGFFLAFMYYSLRMSRKGNVSGDDSVTEMPSMGWLKALFFFALGLTMLIVGGKYFVSSAVEIAKAMGVSEAIIGLTIVAVGTSLPELATSLVAAFKKQPDIAIGNIVGSNILNILFILGTVSTISPVRALDIKIWDYATMIFSAVLLFLFSSVTGRSKINRLEGGILLLGYILYIGVIIYTL